MKGERPFRPEEHTETTIIERYAPNIATFPRWVRKQVTFKGVMWTILWLVTTVFAAGATWTNWLNKEKSQQVLNAIRAEQQELQPRLQKIDGLDRQLAVLEERTQHVIADIEDQKRWRARIEGVAEEQRQIITPKKPHERSRP